MANNNQKSVCPNCRNTNAIAMAENMIVPFEDGTRETQRLFSYFLHKAPDISSSHSKQIVAGKHPILFEQMMNKRHYKYQHFCAANATIEKEFAKGFVDGESLCLKCKRFVCKRKQTTKGSPPETDLDCFLRHIRNSIAHGMVYFVHGGNKIHILFEDKNTTGNLSARIICTKADLEHWKRVLTNVPQ